MSDRIKFNKDARLTDELLNETFDGIEKADRNLAADIGLRGILCGLDATPSPAGDLSVTLTGPGIAYDGRGRRVFAPSTQQVDCQRATDGESTLVLMPGNERWLTLAVRFARKEGAPVLSDFGKVVATREFEASQIHVLRGEEGASGQAERPSVTADDIVLCDVLIREGATAVASDDIDLSRRQRLSLWSASSIATDGSRWQALPGAVRLDDALAAVDAQLAELAGGLSTLVRPEAWGVLPACNTVQAALNAVDAALGRQGLHLSDLSVKYADLVRPEPWEVLQPCATVQDALNAVDRALVAHRGGLDALSRRVDAITSKTHPRARRAHEIIYYSKEVAVPPMGPRESRMLAIRLDGVRPTDRLAFARAANHETAQRLRVDLIAALDGVVRLSFVNTTADPLNLPPQQYEIALLVPEAG